MDKTVMDIVSYVHSGPMQDVYDLIARMGASDAAVAMMDGETPETAIERGRIDKSCRV